MFRSLFGKFAALNPLRRGPRRAARRARPRSPLRLEALEAREVPAVSAFLSGGQLMVNGDSSGNTIRLDYVREGEFIWQRVSQLQGGNWKVDLFSGGTFNKIQVNSGSGSDTVTVVDTLTSATINGYDGYDTVNVHAFSGELTVKNTFGYTDLNAYFDTTTSPQTATIFATSLSVDGKVINYTEADLSELNVYLGSGGNSVTVSDTPISSYYNLVSPNGDPLLTQVDRMETTLYTGRGLDNVVVIGTSGALTIDGENGKDNVSISLTSENIDGRVHVRNRYDYTALTVGDWFSRGGTFTLSAGGLSGLADADITWAQEDLRSLTVTTGYATDIVTVVDTPFNGVYGDDSLQTTLNTGSGNDRVFVQGSTGALTVNGGVGDDILVGDGRGHRFNGDAGRDLLIAGGGASVLSGGAGEDILLGGSTRHDGNPAALDAIMAAWSPTDRAYADRVNDLLAGPLARADFTRNGVANTLTGGADLDLFFGSRARDAHDHNGSIGEVFIDTEGVRIDASALWGTVQTLDYESMVTEAPISVRLLPGSHFIQGYGGSTAYFTVNPDGTIDYDAALDGVLAGRGTASLAVLGREVTIDASALGAVYVALDYTAGDEGVPFSANLLPGQHFIETAGYGYLWFTVNADGTIDYDAALDGIFSGRGTATLMVR